MVSLSRVLELKQIFQGDTGAMDSFMVDIDVQSELTVVRSGLRMVESPLKALPCLAFIAVLLSNYTIPVP